MSTKKDDSVKLYQEYLEYFRKMTDTELICEFNRLHADNGWIGRKITYLGVLQVELRNRNIIVHKPIK